MDVYITILRWYGLHHEGDVTGLETAIRQGVFIETVLWLVPSPLKGSTHPYKYRLALVANGICVLRYDNEAGKGDHRHVGNKELPYRFSTVDALLDDFRSDVKGWLDENGGV